MKMTVEGEQCMGHGRCYRILPDLLDFDDEGYVTIRDQTIEVPPERWEQAEDAEASCPEGAIRLLRD